MSNLENILTDFISFVEKSAAITNPTASPIVGGSTESSGHTAQPTVRVNQTNAISTQPAPILTQPTNKVPTSNAAPKKLDFKSFN